MQLVIDFHTLHIIIKVCCSNGLVNDWNVSCVSCFQYVPSLRKTLKYLNICLSAFSEVYYADGNSFMQRTKNTVMLSKWVCSDLVFKNSHIPSYPKHSHEHLSSRHERRNYYECIIYM